MKHSLFALLLALCYLDARAKDSYELDSPDGKINFTIFVSQNTVFYKVGYKNTPIINNSPLSLSFKEGDFNHNVQISNGVYRDGRETYDLVVGKAKHISEPYKELTIQVQQTQKPGLSFSVVIRAFNGGLGFRYELPQWPGHGSFTLLEENTTFNFIGDPFARTLILPNYTSSHEGLYTKEPLSHIAKDTLIDMPALFEFKNKVYLSITEAALADYAGMYLSKNKDTGVLQSKLSPYPSDKSIKVKASLPHHSP
ncbi:glycoside hydrolase family 97 N-terminal domain-containing protein [Emticicia sp. BO119]|uniref:glycoside hydrolase family 97 N-terminal domain-containing protein n=1 Tax=Emticicia sp. BO119 TaxID=2757768 RepID=UPI001E2B65C2|nr:glycoside hydrolase family 97 N-terminal domain-containing protein [Emticicia sp. BO119]